MPDLAKTMTNPKVPNNTFRPVIAFVGGIYHSNADELLRQTMDVRALDTPSPQEINEALRHCHLAIVRYPYKIDAAALEGAHNLVAIASSGRGTDSINVPACTERGIAVINNPGFGTRPVSEHALGLILALTHKLFLGDAAVRLGNAWDRRTELDVLDLEGRTLGIVGLGLIGMEMARKCIGAFNMKVLAYDPYVSVDVAAKAGVDLLPNLFDVLAQADFVSIHCELNADTFGLINEEALRKMRPHAYLINTARGKVVQQTALIRALSEGWIAGAALDVYEEEPMTKNSPLFYVPKLLLSPHIAGLSGDALRELANSAATQLLQLVQGERPPHLVNPEVWPGVMEKIKNY